MPNRQAKNYIDALLAFWPGLQVLKGDLKGAIKMHESLHQIVQKHDFLPEAVLFDHSVYWGSHPLRPEFLESTYYLYKATKDDHYLNIAKKIVYQLEKYSRVKCGYAALSDVKTKQHEDRMDSFVFAETFKYLYLIFEEDDKILFNLDEFLFSTEAHLLPLNMNEYVLDKINIKKFTNNDIQLSDFKTTKSTCPSLKFLLGSTEKVKQNEEARRIRESIFKNPNDQNCQTQSNSYNVEPNSINLQKLKSLPLRASDFVAGRKDHMEILNKLGIKLTTIQDGRVQLVHKTSDAQSYQDAELGILFMTEMLELSKQKSFQLKHSSNIVLDEYRPISVILFNSPFNYSLFIDVKEYLAGPAQFGMDFRDNYGIFGRPILSDPLDACSPLNFDSNIILYDKILIAKRGGCMFIDKARKAEKAGVLGIIIVDNLDETSHSSSALFAMSGDGVQDVKIPSLFLFGKEGNDLLWNIRTNNQTIIFMGENIKDSNKNYQMNGIEKALNFNTEQLRSIFFSEKKSFFNIINKNIKNSLTCQISDYHRLKYFYDYLNPKSDNSINMKVFIVDEAIELLVHNNKEREININIDYLKSILSNHDELERKIYDQIVLRLEKKTNFLDLKNNNSFKNALFNFVKFRLNLTSKNEDIILLKTLANELEIRSKT